MQVRQMAGQVAIVTGASRGIGAATARLLGRQGVSVVLAARDESWLDLVVKELSGRRGARAMAVPVDISDPEATAELVEATESEFGRVDIIVNSAGVAWPLDRVVDVDADEWAYNVHVNMIGPFYLVHSVLPGMIERGYGRIVNVTCHSGLSPVAGESAYRAAKAGLEMWTAALAAELGGTGVVASCVDPGVVDTAMRREVLEIDFEGGELDLGHWLPDADSASLTSAEDAARMVFWLASPIYLGESNSLHIGADRGWREQVERDLGFLS